MIWTHRGRFAYGLRSSLWRAAGIDDPQGWDLGLGQVAAPSPPGERVCAGVKSRAYPFIHALIFFKERLIHLYSLTGCKLGVGGKNENE